MNYDEAIEIVRSSSREDWIHESVTNSFTYKEDLNLRIEQLPDEEKGMLFKEEWAIKHADSNAHKVFYHLKYNSSIIKRIVLVSVDGHKAELPLPISIVDLRIQNLTDYDVARIINGQELLDDYMQRSGFVRPGE